MLTLQPVNGRIWPASGALTFPVALTTPAGLHAKAQDAIKVGPPFVCTCLDPKGEHLAGVDKLGHVYAFTLKANRYVLLDKAGSRGTCALYQCSCAKTLFVGFEDGSVRAYDVVKSTILGILREHHTQVLSLDARHSTGNDLLSVSQDAIILWDCKKLTRKRCLGGGPHGALHACFTPDEQHVVAGFKNGSFFVWQASNGALVRSFVTPPLPKLPIAPSFPRAPLAPSLSKLDIAGFTDTHPSKAAYSTFAISSDAQLLAAGGVRLPVILVFNLVSGSLLYGLLLPNSAQLAGTIQLMFLPLPHATTLVALCSDGSLRHVDLEKACCKVQLPHPLAKHSDSLAFSMDREARHVALLTAGRVLLYDAPSAWQDHRCVLPLTRLPPANLHHMLAQLSVNNTTGVVEGPASWPADMQAAAAAAAAAEAPQDATAAVGNSTTASASTTAHAAAATPATPYSMQRTALHPQPDLQQEVDVLKCVSNTPQTWGRKGVGAGKPNPANNAPAPASKAAAAAYSFSRTSADAAGGSTTAGAKHQEPGKLIADDRRDASGKLQATTRDNVGTLKPGVVLRRSSLEGLLQQFGEFPSKYRLLIWSFLLKLPRNQLAFQALVNHGLHPTVVSDLRKHYPLASKALESRMAHMLSQLAHWCPVFGATSFLPGLVFPFVKLHMAGATAASSEACFELLATLLINWTRGWFERFPDPPLGILTRVDGLLSYHDKSLAAHLRAVQPGGVASLAWTLLQDLMSGVLPQHDWLKLWDHCITVGPDYLYYFLVAYFMSVRTGILELDTAGRLSAYLAKPPDCNCNKVLRAAYTLRANTPAELWPCATSWDPLPAAGTYTTFTQYPHAAVELFTQERKKVEEAEAALARRRRVVSELSLRSTALAMQACSMAEERRALSHLHQARRDHMRQLDAVMQGEAQRLDDRAKEERLKQVALMERAQAHALTDMRAEWNRELDSLKQDMADRRRMLASQVQRQAESEAIAHLEVAAAQKLADMQHDAAQAAMLARLRDEAQAHAVELESLQRRKVDEWTTQEQQAALQAQADADKGRRMVIAAEEAAAQAAMRADMLTSRMAYQQHISQVEAERQLRTWSSQQAAINRTAAQAEAQRVTSEMDATNQSLALQAQSDAQWYVAEQQRRNQQLTEQHSAVQSAERHARQQLAASQTQMQLLSNQAAVLQQRHALQAANAEEEAQLRALLQSLAIERERAQELAAQLAAQQLALQNTLDQATQQPGGSGTSMQQHRAAGSALPVGVFALPMTSSKADIAARLPTDAARTRAAGGFNQPTAPELQAQQQVPAVRREPPAPALAQQLPAYSSRREYQRMASTRPPPQASLLDDDPMGYDNLMTGMLQAAAAGSGAGPAPASPPIPSSLPYTPRTALAVLSALTRPLDEAAAAESSEEALFSRPSAAGIGFPSRQAGAGTSANLERAASGATGRMAGSMKVGSLPGLSGTRMAHDYTASNDADAIAGTTARGGVMDPLLRGPSLDRWQVSGVQDTTLSAPQAASGTLSVKPQLFTTSAMLPSDPEQPASGSLASKPLATTAVATTPVAGLCPGSVLAALQPHAKASAAAVMHSEVAVALDKAPAQQPISASASTLIRRASTSFRHTSSSSSSGGGGAALSQPRLPGLLGALQSGQPSVPASGAKTHEDEMSVGQQFNLLAMQVLQRNRSSSPSETHSTSLMASGLSSIDGMQQYGRTGSHVSHASRPTASTSTAAGYEDSPEVQSKMHPRIHAHAEGYNQPKSWQESQAHSQPFEQEARAVPSTGQTPQLQQAAAAVHASHVSSDPSDQMRQLRRQDMPQDHADAAPAASSSGDLSDVDGMLDRLRADLALTETDEEEAMQAAFSLRSTPAAPVRNAMDQSRFLPAPPQLTATAAADQVSLLPEQQQLNPPQLPAALPGAGGSSQDAAGLLPQQPTLNPPSSLQAMAAQNTHTVLSSTRAVPHQAEMLQTGHEGPPGRSQTLQPPPLVTTTLTAATAMEQASAGSKQRDSADTSSNDSTQRAFQRELAGRVSSDSSKPFFQRRQWLIPTSTSSSDNGAVPGIVQVPAQPSVGHSMQEPAQHDALAEGGIDIGTIDLRPPTQARGTQQYQRTASARPPPQSTMLDTDGTGFNDLVAGVLSDAAARVSHMAGGPEAPPPPTSTGRTAAPVLSALANATSGTAASRMLSMSQNETSSSSSSVSGGRGQGTDDRERQGSVASVASSPAGLAAAGLGNGDSAEQMTGSIAQRTA